MLMGTLNPTNTLLTYYVTSECVTVYLSSWASFSGYFAFSLCFILVVPIWLSVPVQVMDLKKLSSKYHVDGVIKPYFMF